VWHGSYYYFIFDYHVFHEYSSFNHKRHHHFITYSSFYLQIRHVIRGRLFCYRLDKKLFDLRKSLFFKLLNYFIYL
jgi:hypothetical protein